jgi:hypothetical protein
MSQTRICVLTAAALAVLSLGLMIGRYYVLGDEVKVPVGPGTWKVTLSVRGKTLSNDARVMTATPLDFGAQHVLRELCHSDELLDKPPTVRHPERRQVLWSPRAGVSEGNFRTRQEFYCSVGVPRPTAPMSELAQTLYAPPRPGEYLYPAQHLESAHPQIAALAERLTAGQSRVEEQVEALFHHVDQEIRNEASISDPGMSALECLQNGSGDPAGKSRLLVALCRNRGIPARLVTGLALTRGQEQTAHQWVEAWLGEYWLPLCPFNHHFGRVPHTYLVFGFGDFPIVRGHNVRDLDYGFLIERVSAAEVMSEEQPSRLRQVLRQLSLYSLPPPEQRLVEFLLLLPIAALIVCLYRNLIGLYTFGTFAPALVGLAFRDLGGLPGILVFVSIVLIGWVMRRILDRYHLLQVPRMSLLLSLVVIVLILAIVAANCKDLAATKYISLFPIVILTGMIERFWAMEVEDGAGSSFRSLLGTMLTAASISLFLSLHAVVRHMFRFPETLGLIMAVQLLLGRYTGYRLLELFRFRDFWRPPTGRYQVLAGRETLALAGRLPFSDAS